MEKEVSTVISQKIQNKESEHVTPNDNSCMSYRQGKNGSIRFSGSASVLGSHDSKNALHNHPLKNSKQYLQSTGVWG